MSFVLPFSVEPALDALREATALAMARHGNADIEVKADDTLVTDADRNVEKLLRNRLSVLAPDWSFLGEEGGLVGDADAPCWVIDPIDGTTNYARDIPLWCISVGAVQDGRPIFGMIAVPETSEILWAVEGQGAYKIKRGQTTRLRVRDHLPLATGRFDRLQHNRGASFRFFPRAVSSAQFRRAGLSLGGVVARQFGRHDRALSQNLRCGGGPVHLLRGRLPGALSGRHAVESHC